MEVGAKVPGKVFTPESLAELIVRLSLKDHRSLILDPCCGEGVFLLKAFESLRKLKGESNEITKDPPHNRECLQQIFGIEIEEESVEKTIIKLSEVTGLPRNYFQNILCGDFFKVFAKLTIRSVTTANFDLIIGNPPYIRQELIKDKERIRKIISEKSNNGICFMGHSADLYAYFIEYSTNLLKKEGTLSFITPDKWLDVSYGENLKDFILNNYQIETLIISDANLFADAIVDNVIMILRKEEDQKKREKNLVNFTRIKKETSYSFLEEIIHGKKEIENEFIESINIKQEELDPTTKWSYNLRAPKIYREVKLHPKVMTLTTNNFSYLKRGVTSGADEFFFPKNEQIEKFAIEEEYLLPAVKSPREISGLKITNAPRKILVIPKKSPERKLTKAITNYIKSGTEQGFHNRASFTKKEEWFCLEVDHPALILSPRFTRTGRTKVLWNDIRAIPNQTYYEIRLKDEEENGLFVLACLNSILGSIAYEIEGRIEGRGLLQLAVYELANIPIINPKKISKAEKKEIERQFLSLIKKFGTKFEEEERAKLDEAVLYLLGLSKQKKKELLNSYFEIYQRRLKKVKVSKLTNE